MLAALINFSTPLISCGVTVLPFLLALVKILEVDVAIWLSVTLALGTLFVAGVYMGRLGRKNPWTKGLRMALFGLAAFAIGYLLHAII
jgi:VIT1/CCC1 family predicted Fe2+/Mn2+ transporter